jgi:hypothetical protein
LAFAAPCQNTSSATMRDGSCRTMLPSGPPCSPPGGPGNASALAGSVSLASRFEPSCVGKLGGPDGPGAMYMSLSLTSVTRFFASGLSTPLKLESLLHLRSRRINRLRFQALSPHSAPRGATAPSPMEAATKRLRAPLPDELCRPQRPSLPGQSSGKSGLGRGHAVSYGWLRRG